MPIPEQSIQRIPVHEYKILQLYKLPSHNLPSEYLLHLFHVILFLL